MTRMTTTTTLRRDDLIVEEGPGGFGSHYGIVLQTGDVVFDVLWLDGNSTTRYRHAWGRHIRAISEAELRGARAYREYDPVADLRATAAKVRGERRRGEGVRRGGGL